MFGLIAPITPKLWRNESEDFRENGSIKIFSGLTLNLKIS